MKNLLLRLSVLFTLLIVPFRAEAEGSAEILSVLRNAGVVSPVNLSQWGGTAACFAETDGEKRLIVLERRGEGWQIAIDNPTALIQDRGWPELLLDSDNAVYWTYVRSDTEIVRYHSARNADGTWGPVDQFSFDSGFGDSTHVWSTTWDESNRGEIIRSFSVVDENDNDRGVQLMQILPAAWMMDCIRLKDFDVTRFPTMFIATNDFFSHENERFFREAAAFLMPDYAFLKGMLKEGAMHFLMEKPDGSRVYVICEYMSHREVCLIESTPLPAGTVLGYENFTDSLWIDRRCVTIQLLHNGTHTPRSGG